MAVGLGAKSAMKPGQAVINVAAPSAIVISCLHPIIVLMNGL